MSTAPVHACPEDTRFPTLCHEPEAMSCHADQWTCPAYLRLVALLIKVEAAARRLKWDKVRLILDAVVPGQRNIDHLTEDEARRVLVVLEMVGGK